MPEQSPIGVVIPGYGHPRFLAEAVTSACTQEIDQPLKVVVVDDGCRFVETANVVENLMQLYPGTLHYMRHPNAKLPGARNAGVRFLLEQSPDLDAVYFLDADNRLEPYSLQAFRAELGEDPSVGWAYPDITFFGQVWNAEGFDTRETAPHYETLLHLVGNVSEAGSMVRADAFRSGVWYDESMRSGFEDWEFWLSMLDAGYVGTRVRHAGFSYRKRPESMLANSRRLEESLIAYIRQKHADLYAPRNLLSLEQSANPAFAILCPDTKQVTLFSDPKAERRECELADFYGRIGAWYSASRENFLFDKLLVMTSAQWQKISANPMYLRWFFWKLRCENGDFASIFFDQGEQLSVEGRPWGSATLPDQILMIGQAGLRLLLDDRRNVSNIADLPVARKLLVATPTAFVEGTPAEDADKLYGALIELCKNIQVPETRVGHIHRRYAGPDHSAVREILIDPACASEGHAPYPIAHKRPRVAIAIDQKILNHYKAMETLAHLVQAICEAGAECAIIQEFQNDLSVEWLQASPWSERVTDLFPLQQRGNQEEFRMYLGRRISARLPLSSKLEASTFGRLCDFVVSVGTAGTLETLGDLRGYGVQTAVWLEPVFEGGSSEESFAKMLAYEHAINHVITDTDELANRLSAQGVPPGKVVPLATFLSLTLPGLSGK